MIVQIYTNYYSAHMCTCIICVVHSNSNSRVYCMDSVLYRPDVDTVHGAGCPNSS